MFGIIGIGKVDCGIAFAAAGRQEYQSVARIDRKTLMPANRIEAGCHKKRQAFDRDGDAGHDSDVFTEQ
jgi:hypothetical protein